MEARQTEILTVRLSPELKAWLEAKARKRETSESAVARAALLDAREADLMPAPNVPVAQPA